MSVTAGCHWHLRRLMAEAGMVATTDLVPLLAERGVRLSREQVYRLVAQVPERLPLVTLAALCDILGCCPSDLIEPYRPQPTLQLRQRGGDTIRIGPVIHGLTGPPRRHQTTLPARHGTTAVPPPSTQDSALSAWNGNVASPPPASAASAVTPAMRPRG